jgi:hypothetical protein
MSEEITVYVVVQHDPGGYGILGVFTTPAAAETCRERKAAAWRQKWGSVAAQTFWVDAMLVRTDDGTADPPETP